MWNRTALTSLDACDPLPKLGDKIEQPHELTGEAARAVIYGRALEDFEGRDHGAAQGITEANCQQKESPWPFPSSLYRGGDCIDQLLHDYFRRLDLTQERERRAAVRALEYYSPFKFYF